MSRPDWATLDSRERLRSSSSHTRSCGPDPRISAATQPVDKLPPRSPRRNKKARTRGPSSRTDLTNLTPYQLYTILDDCSTESVAEDHAAGEPRIRILDRLPKLRGRFAACGIPG